MAKKNVVAFSVSDMPKPKKLASGLIGLRSPVDFIVAPNKSEVIDLKTRCNVMLLTQGGVFEPGKNIVVVVKNEELTPEKYAAGDVIARAYVLFPVDYEIE